MDGLSSYGEVSNSLELETKPPRTEEAVNEGMLPSAQTSLPCSERGGVERGVEYVPVASLAVAALVAKVFIGGVREGRSEGLPVEEGRQ